MSARRMCEHCGRASLEGMHHRRRFCDACTAIRHRKTHATMADRRARAAGTARYERVVKRGKRRCQECGKDFETEWVSRWPLFCPACRGRRVLDTRRRMARGLYSRKRNKKAAK